MGKKWLTRSVKVKKRSKLGKGYVKISRSQLRAMTEEIKLRRKKRLMEHIDQPAGNILRAKGLFFQ